MAAQLVCHGGGSRLDLFCALLKDTGGCMRELSPSPLVHYLCFKKPHITRLLIVSGKQQAARTAPMEKYTVFPWRSTTVH